MYTHILWDFNGTLLDDTDAAIKSENVLLARRSMPLIESREQYRSLFCFPIRKYYEKLGHNFEREDYRQLCNEWAVEFKKHACDSGLQDGARELLEKIKERGIKQVVLSASEKEMLIAQIGALKIEEYFDDILGLETVHNCDKTEIGTLWIQKERPRSAVILGDTVHDYEVACQMGIDCILFANGHQSYETLAALCIPVYHSLSDIPAEFFS